MVNKDLHPIASDEGETNGEEGFDAHYIKRLLSLFKERGVPLSMALD